MGTTFDALKENARVDNYLTGTSKDNKADEQQLLKDAKIPKAEVLQ
jgi:hypothetical protein